MKENRSKTETWTDVVGERLECRRCCVPFEVHKDDTYTVVTEQHRLLPFLKRKRLVVACPYCRRPAEKVLKRPRTVTLWAEERRESAFEVEGRG